MAETPLASEIEGTPSGTRGGDGLDAGGEPRVGPRLSPETPDTSRSSRTSETSETSGTSQPLRRRGATTPPKPPTPSLWRRLGGWVAPYALLGLVAAPFFFWYRETVWNASARLLWGRPYMLGLGALLPLLAIAGFHLQRRRLPAMTYSRASDLRFAKQGIARHLAHLPRVLRIVAAALLVVALGRPQQESADVVEVEGVDIVIALDVSNSMSEADLQPDRITAAKEVLRRFVARRKSDRIGLVIFGREAFTQCPLTLDYRALTGLLADVRLGLVDGRGTAIGDALGTALNRLRRSDAKSKVVILLTDGDNNAGSLSPQQAARFAQSLGVKVFTVLVGRDVDLASEPGAPRIQPRYPVNPKLLEEIAGQTGGTPYLATDTAALERRFQQILDELDRSHLKDQKGRPHELYAIFLYPALGLLVLELLLSLTRFRRWP